MTKPAPQFIAPDAYPHMMSKQAGANAMKVMRSAQTAVKAQAAFEAAVPPMRAAILQYVDELEAVAGHMPKIFEKVHEIRGFAETAGLVTPGRTADGRGRHVEHRSPRNGAVHR